MPLLDLFQEGCIGLTKAVDKFDYTKGFNLNLCHMVDTTKYCSCNKVKVEQYEYRSRSSWSISLTKTQHLVQEKQRDPTMAELAEIMQMDIKKLKKIMNLVKEPMSLDTPIGEESDGSIGSFIEDTNTLQPDAQLDVNSLKERYITCYQNSQREKKTVIRMRYGIGKPTTYSLEDIGSQFCLTRERISD